MGLTVARVVPDKVSNASGDVEVMCDMDLAVENDKFVALVGPSACGKSTTLRMIAGLKELTACTLEIGDRVGNDRRSRDRNIAIVFPNDALQPQYHLDRESLLWSQARRHPEERDPGRVSEAAKIPGLVRSLARRPSRLSDHKRTALPSGAEIKIGFRAVDILPREHGQAPAEAWSLESTAVLSEPPGSEILPIIEFGGQETVAKMVQPARDAPGGRFSLGPNMAPIHLFDAASGRATGADQDSPGGWRCRISFSC